MKLNLKISILTIIIIGCSLFVASPLQRGLAKQVEDVIPSITMRSESADYATLELRDPWDMSEYSDISQYLNQSGQVNVVKNIAVKNGIFSGTSVGTVYTGQNGWFHLLFPGYQTAVHLGKSGSHYPIDANQYGCFYIATKINSGPVRDPSKGGPDQHLIYWFANDRLNGDVYGFSKGIATYPEFGLVGAQPTPYWQLLKIDLRSVPNYQTDWNTRSEWQGLRFDPTIQDNVSYEVDWARLTDCNSNQIQVSFQPDSNIKSVWLRPEGTSRYILIAQDVNGVSGSYNLDVQGVAPGRYLVGFGTGSGPNTAPTCCLQESSQVIEINQTPIADFTSPNFDTGEDFATSLGTPWDFSSYDDFYGIRCADYGLTSKNTLWLNTPPPNLQPDECKSGESIPDPSIYLPTPDILDTTRYRYLTYHFSTNDDWQNVPQGMIVRVIWTVKGASGKAGYRCHLVSQDLPYDVGWQTYTVDLWDAFAGSVEQSAGDCSPAYTHWLNSPGILDLQFNPNENITSDYFYQEVDWIRLTKMNQVTSGKPFPIQVSLNKSPDTIQNIDFYYTNDLNDPTRNKAVKYPTPSDSFASQKDKSDLVTSLTQAYQVFLPIVRNKYTPLIAPPSVENEVLFWWSTSSVPPGEYYTCVAIDDGKNQAMYCSETPVKIVP